MSNYHVAVVAFPFATHAGLLYGLVQRLANSLPNVTFTFFSTNKSNSSIFTTTQNSNNNNNTNIKPYDIPDGVPEGHVLGGGGIEEIIGLFFKSAKKNLQNAIASAQDDSGKKITCIMADAFMWFSGEISEELNVSWIPVWTSAAGSLSVHVDTDLIRKNVGIQAFPFATHAGLLYGLVQRLAHSLPNVTFTFFSTNKSNSSIFTTTQNSNNNNNTNIKPYDIPDGVPEGHILGGGGGGGGIEEIIGLFFKSAKKNLQNAIASAEDDSGKKITCIMADTFMWFSGIDGREDEIVKFIPGFSELRLGDLPGGVVLGDLESPFFMMLHKMGKTIGKGTAIPINSFEELDPPIVQYLKSKFNNFLNVGPFNLTSPPPSSNIVDKYGCIEWLDSQEPNSVAYIGFGTIATPSPNELKAMAQALEEKKIPFLWSIKENFMSHFPEGFIENTKDYGKIVSWAPQVQVLEHRSIGVFINHCGWNSVLESIASGVPIICRPFFGDHHLNSWMVEKVWKIGVKIEGGVFTKNVTIEALDLVLFKKREELKEQVAMYKELALKAVGPNGSSTQNFNKLVEIITSC